MGGGGWLLTSFFSIIYILGLVCYKHTIHARSQEEYAPISAPGHGCTNVITPHDDSLEVDNTMLEGERSDKWLEVAGVQLYDEHKEGILESSSWLDDIIVTTA